MKQIFEILQEERDRILNIHESSTKNQYLNTLIVEEKETELITEGQYVTKNFNKLGKSNKYPWALPKNVVFEPSKKLVGYLVGNAKFVYSRRGTEWDREDINYVQYNCSKGKFSIGKGKSYYDYDLYNETLSKATTAP